jgi:hypothetical protein
MLLQEKQSNKEKPQHLIRDVARQLQCIRSLFLSELSEWTDCMMAVDTSVSFVIL